MMEKYFAKVPSSDKPKKQREIVLAIVGGRTYHNHTEFVKFVEEWIAKNGCPVKIVSGGAMGADTMAHSFAKDNCIKFEVFAPDWDKFGKDLAGLVRNTQIVAACTHLLAFPTKHSRGTYDSIRKAKKQGKVVTIHQV